jgi:hypothetical protein
MYYSIPGMTYPQMIPNIEVNLFWASLQALQPHLLPIDSGVVAALLRSCRRIAQMNVGHGPCSTEASLG